jgi:hypothetical protein
MGVEMPSTLINVSNRLPVAETLKGALALPTSLVRGKRTS